MNDEEILEIVWGNIDSRVFWASRNELVQMLFYSTTPMTKFFDLSDCLDPEGKNILHYHFIHNDTHLRSCWLTKFKNEEAPQEIVIDLPLGSIGHEIFKELREVPQEVKDKTNSKLN